MTGETCLHGPLLAPIRERGLEGEGTRTIYFLISISLFTDDFTKGKRHFKNVILSLGVS